MTHEVMPSPDIIKATYDWFVTAGQANADGTPNFRQIAFYLGMKVEELTENLELVFGVESDFCRMMHHVGYCLKNGTYDEEVERAVRAEPKKFLDGDLDLFWVTTGSLAAQGAKGSEAYAHVAERNWAKFPDGVVTRDPVSGKVQKPNDWVEPDLTPFIHPTLRGELG